MQYTQLYWALYCTPYSKPMLLELQLIWSHIQDIGFLKIQVQINVKLGPFEFLEASNNTIDSFVWLLVSMLAWPHLFQVRFTFLQDGGINPRINPSMVIRVVGFSSRGYKIRKVFAYKSTTLKEMIKFWELVSVELSKIGHHFRK